MIPSFPRFKKLSLSDKRSIERYTQPYLPYSDYNFASIWSYNTQNRLKISKLNNNLVLLFPDYITGEAFLTFLGTTKVSKTVDALVAYAEQYSLLPTLQLIPHDVIEKSNKQLNKKYVVREDEGNHDYIFSIDALTQLTGNRYRGKRNFIHRFLTHFPDHSVRILNLSNKNARNDIEKLCQKWRNTTHQSKEETQNELKAIQRMVKNHSALNVLPIAVYVKDRLKAFAIVEKTFHDYGILHFEKADNDFTGIFQFLKQVVAVELKKLGCTHLNVEQDLNIEGLRKSKQSWDPTHFLKKYTITPKALTKPQPGKRQ